MEYSGNNTKKVPDIYSEFLTFFGFGCFSIGITPALIDFEQGSEVRVIVLDTMIFHPRHNEKIDPRFGSDTPCLMDIIKQFHLKTVADGIGQMLQSDTGHIVVVFHRLVGEGWNNDRDCSALRNGGGLVRRLLLKMCLDHSGLLRVAHGYDGRRETVNLTRASLIVPVVYLVALMGIPLRQIRRQT